MKFCFNIEMNLVLKKAQNDLQNSYFIASYFTSTVHSADDCILYIDIMSDAFIDSNIFFFFRNT